MRPLGGALEGAVDIERPQVREVPTGLRTQPLLLVIQSRDCDLLWLASTRHPQANPLRGPRRCRSDTSTGETVRRQTERAVRRACRRAFGLRDLTGRAQLDECTACQHGRPAEEPRDRPRLGLRLRWLPKLSAANARQCSPCPSATSSTASIACATRSPSTASHSDRPPGGRHRSPARPPGSRPRSGARRRAPDRFETPTLSAIAEAVRRDAEGPAVFWDISGTRYETRPATAQRKTPSERGFSL